MSQANPFIAFLARYGPAAGEEGPVRFVREVLGTEPDEWQEKVLRAYGRGERHMAIRSCHGPGKTCVAAWLVLHMLLMKYPQKTVATAPTGGQLHGALVPEVKSWFRKLPKELQDLYEPKTAGIYLKSAPESSFFEARTSRAESPEALQGIHSDNVLLICDEASGIPEAIFKAAVGSMSSEGALTLMIGNPVRTSGTFFDAFHRNKMLWWTLRVGHGDSPRVTDKFVEFVRAAAGEDSAEFRIRCLGEFPKADDDTAIPYAWIHQATERDIVELPHAKTVWGLDVARFGSDKNVLAERSARKGRVLDAWGQLDLMETAGRVKARWDNTAPHERPGALLVDDIGLGSGVLDRLRELGLPAKGVNVAESAAMSEKFTRARDELWWKCREWFQGRNVIITPPETDDRNDSQAILVSELGVPRYAYTSSGKIKIEAKEEMKKRIGKSPDYADAFVLTFAEDLTAAAFGSNNSRNWDKPLKRDLATV